MTEKLIKKLDEVKAADYGQDHMKKYKELAKIKRLMFRALHPEQQEAINKAYMAMAEVTNAYRELYHPSYDDIVNLDNSFWHLRNAFAMDDDQ